MKPIDGVLKCADNVRRVGSSWLVSCPVPGHGKGRGDVNPSVSVSEGDEGRALVECKAGCKSEEILAEWGLTWADLFEHHNGHRRRGSYTYPQTRSTDQPATLENYVTYVRLPVKFLKSLGLKEYRHLGEPAVSMPYLDKTGEEVLVTRSRVSLTGRPKVKTRKGGKHRLYGLCKLEDARETGYVWAVEGESDSQTLWYHSEPAVGIPGANGWKAEWAADLAGIDRIFFVVEDEAGEVCWEKLAATPEISEKLYRVELDCAKDLSELHKQAPESFKQRLRSARESAKAWFDIAETEEREWAREAWDACREPGHPRRVRRRPGAVPARRRVRQREAPLPSHDQQAAREDRERSRKRAFFRRQIAPRKVSLQLLPRVGDLPVHGVLRAHAPLH